MDLPIIGRKLLKIPGKDNNAGDSSYLSLMRKDDGLLINRTSVRPFASYVNIYKCLEKK